MKESIKKNYFYNVLYQILSIITPLITTPYISRVLDAKGIGSISYAESIVSYFVLFATLGVTTYGQREVSYVQSDNKKRTEVFWNVKIFEMTSSVVAIFAYVIFSFNTNNRLLYVCLICNLLAVFFDVTWFFQGMEEFKKIVYRNVIIKLCSVVYIFVFVNSIEDIYSYAFGVSFFALISNISLWIYIPKYLVKMDDVSLHPFREWKKIVVLFVPTIAINIYTVLDKTMIGAITQDYSQNGFYEQAIKISKMILTLITSLGAVMIPRVGAYIGCNKEKDAISLLYKSYRFVLFLGIPLCFGTIAIAPLFVPLFYGKGYEGVTRLLQVLAMLIIAIGINNVTGMQYLIPAKKESLFSCSVIIGAVVNLMLNLILIRTLGAMGAAISSVVAESVIAIVQFVMVGGKLSIVIVAKNGKNYYLAGSIMFVILMWMEEYCKSDLIHIMMMFGVGVISYFGLLIIIRDEFFRENVRTLLKR